MGVNSLQWYYLPGLGKDEQSVSIDGDEWHHCFNVVRMREGDALVLCNGKGLCVEGAITKATSRSGQIQILRDISNLFMTKRSYRIHVAVAPTKSADRLEFAIEKLVEIGVDELTLLDCDHNERSHLRLDRFQKIIVSAGKQSKKLYFPLLHPLVSPETFIRNIRQEKMNADILCCHLEDSSASLSENYSAGGDVVVLIGPEGGFSIEEISMMKLNNVKLIHLGPHRLRVETAAIVACSGIHLLNQLNKKI